MSMFGHTDNSNNNTIPFPQAEVVKNQEIQTSSHIEQLQFKLDQLQRQYDNLSNDTKIIEYHKSLKVFKIITLSVFGFIFIVFVTIYFLLKKKSREYIINQILYSHRIEKKFSLNEVKQYTLSEKDLNTITDRVLKSRLLTPKDIQDHQEKIKETVEQSKPVTKYLKGKSGKIFTRVEHNPDNSFFKLYNETDDTALFEFCGNETEALAKRIFNEDICKIISGNYQNARSVITSKPGKIRRIGEQWVVTEPIQIKLI